MLRGGIGDLLHMLNRKQLSLRSLLLIVAAIPYCLTVTPYWYGVCADTANRLLERLTPDENPMRVAIDEDGGSRIDFSGWRKDSLPYRFSWSRALHNLGSRATPVVRLDIHEHKSSITKLDDDAIAEIGKLGDLRELEIFGWHASDNAFRALSRLSKLRELELAFGSVSAEQIRYLQPLHEIRTIRLRHCRLLPNALVEMAKLPTLTTIDLSCCRLFDNRLGALANLPALTFLNLSQCELFDNELDTLANMPALTEIDLSYCPLQDGDLLNLSTIKSLKRVVITDGPPWNKQFHPRLSAEGISTFREIRPDVDLRD